MGFLDFLLTKQMKRNKVATQIGLESGLFVRCPVCHGVTESKTPEAYQQQTSLLAHQLITTNAPGAALFNRDETLLLKTIDQVGKDLPYHCVCESI